jgi:hypothetical protein
VLVRRLLLTLLVLGATGALAGLGTFGAWSAPTTSAGNGFATGSVVLSDNDTNTQMFSVPALKPTSPVAERQRCIKLTYSGSLPANVTLHGAVTGTLATYLTLRVERGTDAGTTPSRPAARATARRASSTTGRCRPSTRRRAPSPTAPPGPRAKFTSTASR